MARAKRILSAIKRFTLTHDWMATCHRLVEVEYGPSRDRVVKVMCLRCANKLVAEENKAIDRSNYKYNKSGNKIWMDAARIRHTVSSFEKLKCHQCGKRNER